MPTIAKPELLERWRVRSTRQVTLPTGTRIKMKIPPADLLVRQGVMPTDLRDLAMRFATTGFAIEELSDEALQQFLRMKNVMIAWAVQAIYAGDKPYTERIEDDDPDWQAIELSPDDVDELDGDDIGALSSIVMRQSSPNEITAAVWRDFGKLEPQTIAVPPAEGDGDETTAAFRAVRGIARRADAGTDGENVGLPAESDGRDTRSSRGDRLRRSAGDPSAR